MKKGFSLKIGISGIRGIVGESLTPQLASSFAQTFGTYIGGGKVIVGQDARSSGMMIKNAVFSGLLSVGCQPVDIGICPIPSTMVLAKENPYIGAVVVTASHNPPEWNGLKFISGKGLFLNHLQVQEFLDIYHQGEFSWVNPERYKTPITENNPTSSHLQKLMDYLDVDSIKKNKFSIVADCNQGAGLRLLPNFLELLGCKVIFLDQKNKPQDIPSLCREVLKNKADIGFAQDADADRLAIINEKGFPLGEELTLAIAVDYILSKKPGPVVINLSTSRAIEDIAFKYGAPLYRTKIGEINVVEELLHKKAVIGGEGNGGVIFPSIHPCRDSFTAIGLTLEAMSKSQKSISQLQESIPKYFMVKDQIKGSYEQAFRILRLLKKKFQKKEDISTIDGLKFDFKDSWLHIRPSNTEPIIRIFAEAKNQQKAKILIERFKQEIKDILDGNHY
ncbi:phosphoglucosamine mutase [Acidobacteriota bacterium]